MRKRTITGAAIAVVIYTIVYFSNRSAVIHSAAAVLSVAAVYELHRATAMQEEKWGMLTLFLAAVLLTVLPNPQFPFLMGVLFPCSVVVFALLMARQEQCRFERYTDTVALSLVITLMFKSMPEVAAMEHGRLYLLFAVTVCFVTDVAAFLVGKTMGRHKLLPKVSPNKTVEGSVGGVVFAVMAMLLLGLVVEQSWNVTVNYPVLMVYALLASVVGQFGDLAMSVTKRICGIKDFGNLLPGHGGVLDRFDSHLFSVTFTLLFCCITGGFLR